MDEKIFNGNEEGTSVVPMSGEYNDSVAMTDADVNNVLGALKNNTMNCYCSIEDDGTRESKIKRYNAIDAKERLGAHLGEQLKIKDVLVHEIELEDKSTGELIKNLRCVLIDENGVGYASVSRGVISSLQKIYGLVGAPTWNEPLIVVPQEVITSNKFKVLTLALA